MSKEQKRKQKNIKANKMEIGKSGSRDEEVSL